VAASRVTEVFNIMHLCSTNRGLWRLVVA